jgi:hypothetical protein
MLTALSVGRGGLGRFGNTLFTIAGVIGIATKSGQPFGFPEWKIVDNERFGQPVDSMADHFVNPLPQHIQEANYNEYGYFWGYRDINLPHGNWTIDAHMQDPRFFSHCMDTIRHYFRMKDEPEQKEYVAIHYRAGDYIGDPAAYHPRCDLDYYKRAMLQFPEETKFIVFTDDLAAAENMFSEYMKDGEPILGISEGRTYLQDFAFMKRCKSFICANSSFSYMAALLGDHPEKKIILPRRWFGSSAGISFDGYHENAIVL